MIDAYYQDADGDGFGNEVSTARACAPPESIVEGPSDGVSFDCDDTRENGGTLKLFYDTFQGDTPSLDYFGRIFDAGPDSGRCVP